MKKILCDCCGEETSRSYYFEYLCHLDPSGKWHGQTDYKGNSISGRHESKDLCLKCYNTIGAAAIKVFTDLQKKYLEEEKK